MFGLRHSVDELAQCSQKSLYIKTSLIWLPCRSPSTTFTLDFEVIFSHAIHKSQCQHCSMENRNEKTIYRTNLININMHCCFRVGKKIKHRVFIPIGKRLQLEWFVIEQPVELRNLHHPRYLGCHHWVIHFIWKCKEHTHAGWTCNGYEWWLY